MLGELLLHLLPVPRVGHVVHLLQPHPLRLAQHAVQVDVQILSFNLSYDRGGGALCARHFLFIFLLKISPPDQTLRPT